MKKKYIRIVDSNFLDWEVPHFKKGYVFMGEPMTDGNDEVLIEEKYWDGDTLKWRIHYASSCEEVKE